ncbi:MAG: hypothetical protein ABIH21_05010, partial [Patescibacteria group bacterium]
MAYIKRTMNKRYLSHMVCGAVLVGIAFVSFFPSSANASSVNIFSDQFPQDLSLVINNGATCTGSETVQVHFEGKNVKWVVLGSSHLFTTELWQDVPDSMTMDFILEGGDGTKTVYAIFKSSMNMVSTVVYDSIELDKATNCGVVVATQSDEPELLDPIDQPVEQSPEAALVVRT